MNQGVWILPSRGRPERLAVMIESCRETGAESEKVVVALDLDDPKSKEYFAMDLPKSWARVSQADCGSANAQNMCVKLFPDAEFYGLLADDLVAVTPGWARELAREARAGYLTWAQDDVHGKPTHPVIPGYMVRGLGWVAPPGVVNQCTDWWWEAVATALGKVKPRLDLTVRHMHWVMGRGKKDETYALGTASAPQDYQVVEKLLRDLSTYVAKVAEQYEKEFGCEQKLATSA